MRLKYGLLTSIWACSMFGILQAKDLPKDFCSPRSGGDAEVSVQLTGELSKKGSDMDSWWALRVASGKIYRLQLQTSDQEKNLFAWQNGFVTVSGRLRGQVLSVELVCVDTVTKD